MASPAQSLIQWIFVSSCNAAAVVASAATGQASVNVISPEQVSASSRIVIAGAGLGSDQGSGVVTLDGVAMPVTRWNDDAITAYIPGGTPIGAALVQVVNSSGEASTPVPLSIESACDLPPQVRWRFQVDSAFIQHRAAVAADGTVYVQDIGGFVYALDASGALQWIFDTAGQGGSGPVAIGGDGTIYVESNPLGSDVNIVGINPDGTLKWTFTDSAQEVIAGPSIGPDGNIYVVTDFTGLGAFALSPSGELLWNTPGFSDFGTAGTEIVFSSSQLHVCLDGFFSGLQLDGQTQWTNDIGSRSKQVAIDSDGNLFVESFVTGAGIRLQSFDAAGDLRWTAFESPTNLLTAPNVGPDGTVFIVRNGVQVLALNPDESERWSTIDDNNFGPVTASSSPTTGPVVSPDGGILVIGGIQGFGQPGVVKAFAADDGETQWEVVLPIENGGRVIPNARPIFAPDSATTYVGMSIPGQVDVEPYSYLYAFKTDAVVSGADINGDGVVNISDLLSVLAAWGNCDACPADLSGDGVVDFTDLLFVLTSWDPC